MSCESCVGSARGHSGTQARKILAPAEGLHGAHHAVRARYSDFAICSCGGILQICQWYRVCDAGALRAEPLATLLSCAVKTDNASSSP